MPDEALKAFIDYEDPYVQPLILEAFKKLLPSTSYDLVSTLPTENGSGTERLLQFRAYESLDFAHALAHPNSLLNSYVIRKALIRKHYLAATIFSWVTKHPQSSLKRHFRPAVEFEVDYAEFLDDALLEAYELKESFQKNQDLLPQAREWWILKPGMGDRGQGIRVFSTEEELTQIFEEWDAENPDEDDEDEDTDTGDLREDTPPIANRDYITTSHLRHFIAQPYIHPPLLFPEAPFNNRKFHIRTYVIASGALEVYVYKHMLALFASTPYEPPWVSGQDEDEDVLDALDRFRNIHLTNTCVQNAQASGAESNELKEGHVYQLSNLPLNKIDYESIQDQIFETVREVFRAASALPTNFQPLPQSFEVFGIDFLVADRSDAALDGSKHEISLLEVNAFPDFAQTGEELRDVIVKGLLEEVVRQIIAPHFGIDLKCDLAQPEIPRLEKVLAMDMGIMQAEEQLSGEVLRVRGYSTKRFGVFHKTHSLFQRARYYLRKRPHPALNGDQTWVPDSSNDNLNASPERNVDVSIRRSLRRKAISLSGSLGFRRRNTSAILDYSVELRHVRHGSRLSSASSEVTVAPSGVRDSLNDRSERRVCPVHESTDAPRLPPLAMNTEFDRDDPGTSSLEQLFSNNNDTMSTLALNREPCEVTSRRGVAADCPLAERSSFISSVDDIYETGVPTVPLGIYSHPDSDNGSVCRTPSSKRGHTEEILWGSRELPVRRGEGSFKKVLKPLRQLKEYASRNSLRLSETDKKGPQSFFTAPRAAGPDSNRDDTSQDIATSQAQDSSLSNTEDSNRSNHSESVQRGTIRLIGEPIPINSNSSLTTLAESDSVYEDAVQRVFDPRRQLFGQNQPHADTRGIQSTHQAFNKRYPWPSPNASELSNTGTDELPNWHSYRGSHPMDRSVRQTNTNIEKIPQISTSGQSQSPSLD